MSNTRHAAPGAPLRQERFASSYEPNLLANLVAKRCAVIDPPSDRVPIWFLQSLSMIPGGLGEAVCEILKANPLTEWRAVHERGFSFDVKKDLERALRSLCLDPNYPLTEIWEAAGLYRQAMVDGLADTPQTQVTIQIKSALDYTLNTRCLSVIDGQSRIGKTFAAKDWCAHSGGIARYVQAPSSNDDISFFRAVGRALGVSNSLQLKASEIRARVEDVIKCGDIMLVIDEAHYLWPQSWQRYAMPSRINWLMTEAVNSGVAVALVTTPQFHVFQRKVEKLTGWNSEQFIGRIGHLERLPETLSLDDLLSVARYVFPEGDDLTWEVLSRLVKKSPTRLAGIDTIVKRARWFASQEGRQKASPADLRRVISEKTPVSAGQSDKRPEETNFTSAPRHRRGTAAAFTPDESTASASVAHIDRIGALVDT
ncbi:MAG: ATP-binding protein [Verrucomicrobiota bacterium]